MSARRRVSSPSQRNPYNSALAALALAGGSALLAGCGSYEPWTPEAEQELQPEDKPARTALEDIEFSMTAHIGAGKETQRCLNVRLPDDRGVMAVPAAESHYTPGSHHFLVYRTGGTAMPPGGDKVHECAITEQVVGLEGTYYEAQQPDEERVLPDGVAHLFEPGEVLLLTSHYLNTTEDDIDASVEFKLHTISPDDIEHEAGSIFFYNYDISLPPNSERTVTRTCPVPEEINLALLWGHMHKRGLAFRARTDDAKVNDRIGDLYDTDEWNEPPARAYPTDPPVMLHKGSTINYQCDFKNDSSNTIVQGQSADTNEMCILHGMYWPRVPSFELCRGGVSGYL
jgi:hypothetical protein